MSGAFWNLRRRADLADTGCGAFRYGAVLFLFYPDRGAGIRGKPLGRGGRPDFKPYGPCG